MRFDYVVDEANEQVSELSFIMPTRSNRTNLCFECEEAIPQERLKATPGVERCLECQQDLEGSRKAGRVRAV